MSLPQLPPVPAWTPPQIREGDAYTVQGAISRLRSPYFRSEVKGRQITVEGVIVRSNLEDAPACAVHATGKADPDDCMPFVPAFWIGDSPGAVASIKVMGFASNYAQIYTAIRQERSEKACSSRMEDEFLGTELPCPMPAVGARVRVSGTYDFAYTKATSGIDTDPRQGILTYVGMESLAPAPKRATLPGMGP